LSDKARALSDTQQALQREAAALKAEQVQAQLALDSNWRARIQHAELLYDNALQHLAKDEFPEAGAYFLRAYLRAPYDQIPPGFTARPGETTWASFAWEALGLSFFAIEHPSNIALPEDEHVRSLRYGPDGTLFIATNRHLLALDTDQRRLIGSLDLRCRDMTLINQRKNLLVTTEDSPPLLISIAGLRVVRTLDDGVKRDCTWVRSDPDSSSTIIFDRASRYAQLWTMTESSPITNLEPENPGNDPIDFFMGNGSLRPSRYQNRLPDFPINTARGDQCYAKEGLVPEEQEGWILSSRDDTLQVFAGPTKGEVVLRRSKPLAYQRHTFPWANTHAFEGLGGVDPQGKVTLVAKDKLLYVEILDHFNLLAQRSLPNGQQMRAFAYHPHGHQI
jgi:hypothetical protein